MSKTTGASGRKIASLPAPPVLARAGKPQSRTWRALADAAAIQVYLGPMLIIFASLVLVPVLATVFLSFTDFNGYSFNFHLVGLANYSALFANPQIVAGLTFSAMYAVATTVVVTVIAVPLALVLNRRFAGRNFVRATLFFPAVPSLIVLGLVWAYIFSPISSGVFNSVLHDVLGIGPVPWLAQNLLAQISVITVGVWAQAGWHATLYLAYLQSISADYYDAAAIDGASALQRFFQITLPLLAPAMTVSVVLLMTGGLRVYELPLALTNGGPVYSTYTVTQNIVLYGVSQGEYGLGSALSVVFLLIVAVVLLLTLWVLRWREGQLS